MFSPTKRCSRCKIEKTITKFGKSNRTKDHLRPECNDCRRASERPWVIPKSPVPDGFKRCSCCKEIKPRTSDYFPRDKSSSDGFWRYCKDCTSVKNKANYLANPEPRRRAARDYHQQHRDQANKKRKDHYYKNRDHNLMMFKIRRQTKPETVRAELRDWRLRNQHTEHYKAVKKIRAHERLSRERELPCTFTESDWQYALSYFNHCCAICGRPQGLWHTLSADHWIPLSSPVCPGTVPTNIVPLCHGQNGCNNRKSNKAPAAWLIETFGKRRAKQRLKRIEDYFESLRKD